MDEYEAMEYPAIEDLEFLGMEGLDLGYAKDNLKTLGFQMGSRLTLDLLKAVPSFKWDKYIKPVATVGIGVVGGYLIDKAGRRYGKPSFTEGAKIFTTRYLERVLYDDLLRPFIAQKIAGSWVGDKIGAAFSGVEIESRHILENLSLTSEERAMLGEGMGTTLVEETRQLGAVGIEESRQFAGADDNVITLGRLNPNYTRNSALGAFIGG
jgi:hypothetical protein